MLESSLGDLRRLGKDGGEAKKGGESSIRLHKRKKSERSELSMDIHPRRDSLSPQYTRKSDLRKKRKTVGRSPNCKSENKPVIYSQRPLALLISYLWTYRFKCCYKFIDELRLNQINRSYELLNFTCSVSRWRPHKVDKRMVLEYTHGLFIT